MTNSYGKFHKEFEFWAKKKILTRWRDELVNKVELLWHWAAVLYVRKWKRMMETYARVLCGLGSVATYQRREREFKNVKKKIFFK